MSDLSHSMRAVVKRTGLSPHVIRIWEKRYGAVDPVRTPTNRRLYTDQEVDRLMLLKLATDLGHSIGQVARLSTGDLRSLLRSPDLGALGGGFRAAASVDRGRLSEEVKPVERPDYLQQCVEAVHRLDSSTLEQVLHDASLELGSQGLLAKLVAPLAQTLGRLWQQGEITAAQEHFASAVIRVFLGNLARPFALPESAPRLVVATPSGQLHELGAVLVAAAASAHGWRVTYLGVSLPAAEIAGAAVKNRARAVALSLVYPKDDPQLPAELESMRHFLPPEIPVLVGGRAAGAYQEALDRIGARSAKDLSELYDLLDVLRSR